MAMARHSTESIAPGNAPGTVAMALPPQQQLAAVAAAGLLEHAADVAFDRAGAQPQLRSDLAVAAAVEQQRQHPRFGGADAQQGGDDSHTACRQRTT